MKETFGIMLDIALSWIGLTRTKHYDRSVEEHQRYRSMWMQEQRRNIEIRHDNHKLRGGGS
jgi:hypothetical protein